MIEIINLDDSVDIQETDTPNWREQQNLAIKDYKVKQKVTEEWFRAVMDKNKLKENTKGERRQGGRIRNVPDRYGNTNPAISVKYLLLKNNDPSAISEMTVDNAFANHSVGNFNDSIFSKQIDKQKKREKIDVENKDAIISKQKKRKMIDVIKISAVTVIISLKI